MKVESFKRITKTDIPDLPEWAEPIVDEINSRFDLLTTVLQGFFTLQDNALAEIRTLQMPHDVIVPIELERLRRSPIGVLLLSASLFDYGRLAWKMSDTRSRTIDVKVKYDSVPAEPPDATILVLGG